VILQLAMVQARRRRGLSQRGMAKRLGLSQQRLCEIETASNGSLTESSFERYCEALGVTPRSLLLDYLANSCGTCGVLLNNAMRCPDGHRRRKVVTT